MFFSMGGSLKGVVFSMCFRGWVTEGIFEKCFVSKVSKSWVQKCGFLNG